MQNSSRFFCRTELACPNTLILNNHVCPSRGKCATYPKSMLASLILIGEFLNGHFIFGSVCPIKSLHSWTCKLKILQISRITKVSNGSHCVTFRSHFSDTTWTYISLNIRQNMLHFFEKQCKIPLIGLEKAFQRLFRR